MGLMIYGNAPAIEVTDRALRHLQAVIIAKLRRNESFSFSWDNEPDVGDDQALEKPGRHGSVWISKSSLLYFSYDTAQTAPLDTAWLDVLMHAANSPGGLRVLPEPQPSK